MKELELKRAREIMDDLPSSTEVQKVSSSEIVGEEKISIRQSASQLRAIGQPRIEFLGGLVEYLKQLVGTYIDQQPRQGFNNQAEIDQLRKVVREVLKSDTCTPEKFNVRLTAAQLYPLGCSDNKVLNVREVMERLPERFWDLGGTYLPEPP